MADGVIPKAFDRRTIIRQGGTLNTAFNSTQVRTVDGRSVYKHPICDSPAAPRISRKTIPRPFRGLISVELADEAHKMDFSWRLDGYKPTGYNQHFGGA